VKLNSSEKVPRITKMNDSLKVKCEGTIVRSISKRQKAVTKKCSTLKFGLKFLLKIIYILCSNSLLFIVLSNLN